MISQFYSKNKFFQSSNFDSIVRQRQKRSMTFNFIYLIRFTALAVCSKCGFFKSSRIILSCGSHFLNETTVRNLFAHILQTSAEGETIRNLFAHILQTSAEGETITSAEGETTVVSLCFICRTTWEIFNQQKYVQWKHFDKDYKLFWIRARLKYVIYYLEQIFKQNLLARQMIASNCTISDCINAISLMLIDFGLVVEQTRNLHKSRSGLEMFYNLIKRISSGFGTYCFLLVLKSRFYSLIDEHSRSTQIIFFCFNNNRKVNMQFISFMALNR
ncbi:hypothetical protein BpHYR1_043666 [Brachionus plicatilis]|uniref:Uncharacterized protein n=1 Tax=Brachionus plicatilis TaxID=10195 RepID=A0A3M7QS52_BRAPC|nr:hypothetical protein BpHYR1_043666 [Brachionus plicatilis]